MANWVVDKGLYKLRDQINAAAPGRSKASDGFIGDTAHQATESDHNPEHPPPPGNPDNQVDAGDFTHDPAHNADMGIVSEAIRRSKDPRVAYVIYNRRIYSGNVGSRPWAWREYLGSDPHTGHMHISVLDLTHDQTQPWQIGIDMATTPPPVVYAQYDRDRLNATLDLVQGLGAKLDTLIARPPAGPGMALTPADVDAIAVAVFALVVRQLNRAIEP